MFDNGALLAALAVDPEFLLAVRYWTGRIVLVVDETESVVRIKGGRVLEPADTTRDEGPAIRVAASATEWAELLSPTPRPFYQDLYGAAFRHGFQLTGDDAVVAAYYPAVRRLVDVLRMIRAA